MSSGTLARGLNAVQMLPKRIVAVGDGGLILTSRQRRRAAWASPI